MQARMTAAMSDYDDYVSNWTSVWNSSHGRRQGQVDDEDAVVDDDLSERRAVLDAVQTVAFKLLVPPIVLFGCLGNIINIVVLTRKSMKSSTNRYLTCLAVYDILYLVFAFSMILKHYHHVGQSHTAACSLMYRPIVATGVQDIGNRIPKVDVICSTYMHFRLRMPYFCAIVKIGFRVSASID